MSGILQLVNTFPSGGAFAVQNSLRFRASASAYLSRTPSSTGNQKTFTFSAWVKRGQIGQVQALMSAPVTGGYPNFGIAFTASDQLRLFASDAGSTTIVDKVSNAVYRDPSAWYHVVVSADFASTQANLYVNGVQITSFATNTGPTNTACVINTSGVAHAIGEFSSTWYLDGYLAEINFIDGQALTPSSFGANDPTSGVWKPVKYSGTYGTNGFYLNFINGTSTTTLGYDASGNGNNWTTNNISLTAGSTYDWMLDSPTNYANGGNGVGNYAVLNPTDASASGIVIDGNLGVSIGANVAGVVGSMAVTSGKWYWEFTAGSASTNSFYVSICDVTQWFAPGQTQNNMYYSPNVWTYYGNSGQKINNGTASSYGATFTNGDVIGVALDMDAGTLTFYKNNTSQGTAFTGLTGKSMAAWIGNGASSASVAGAINFGQRPFAYTPPTGFNALNTQNLPAASIVNGANYFAASIYTGTGATQSISNAVNGVSFQPDFVWIKMRSSSGFDHVLQDSVRGAGKALFSDLTNAESSGIGFTSFNSNGFTLSGTTGDISNNGSTFIGWQWKANGTAVTNTAGSITSQVSANTTSGFSVATYTGAGGNSTVGHGLGVAPSMVIVKSRSTADAWAVYHASLGNTVSLYLQSTSASQTIALWNNTSPTSSVFTVSDISAGNGTVNWSGRNYVAYCFAAIPGYSAFGSYTGNGSTSGPFVYCGFRPRYVLVKASSTTGDWCVLDTSRSPYNLSAAELYPNLSNAEGTGTNFEADIVSNGFVLRGTGADSNGSGVTYIYACFAENPLKYSLAR